MKRKYIILTAILAVIALVIGAYCYIEHRVTKQVTAELNHQITLLQPIMKIQYGKIRVNPFFHDIIIKNITLTPIGTAENTPITIGQLNLQISEKNGQISKAVVMAKDIETPINNSALAGYPQLRDALRVMGINTIRSRAFFAYQYDAAAKTVKVIYNHDFIDLGKFGIAFVLNNYNPNANILGIFSLSLQSFRFYYQDNALVKQLIKVLAQEKNMTPQVYLAQVQQQLILLSSQAASPIQKEAYQAFSTFLQDPKNLIIIAEPPRSMLLAKLQGLSFPQFLQAMDVKVQANVDAKQWEKDRAALR